MGSCRHRSERREGAAEESRADPQGKEPTWEALRCPRDVEMQRTSEEGRLAVMIISSSKPGGKEEIGSIRE